jgi:hypothetical protein
MLRDIYALLLNGAQRWNCEKAHGGGEKKQRLFERDNDRSMGSFTVSGTLAPND